MDLGLENPLCRAFYWTATPVLLDDFIVRTEALLRDLRAVHRGFTALHFVRPGDRVRPSAVAGDLANVRPWLLAESWNRQWPKSYTVLDERQRPALTSAGIFSASFSNWESFDNKFDISLGVTPFRDGYKGECVINLPRNNNAEFTQGPLPFELLAAVVRHWPITHADYTTGGLLKAVNREEPRERWIGTRDIGWLTYSSDVRIAESLPADVSVQSVGTGVCFRIGARMPQSDDQQAIAQLRGVREALRKANTLSVEVAHP